MSSVSGFSTKPSQWPDGTVDLVLPSGTMRIGWNAVSEALLELSRQMVQIEAAGPDAYSESADRIRQFEQDTRLAEVENIEVLRELQNKTEDESVRLHSSSLYRNPITAGKQAEQLYKKVQIDMDGTALQTVNPSELGVTECMCLHTLHNGQHNKYAVLCVLANLPAQMRHQEWRRLGRAVMQVLEHHNSSGGYKIHRVRIQEWRGLTEVSDRQSFLRGMASLNNPRGKIIRIEAVGQLF